MSFLEHRILVPLIPSKIEILKKEAILRNKKTARCGSMTYTPEDLNYQDAWEKGLNKHITGLKGEAAVEACFGRPRDRKILDHGDDGRDFILLPPLNVTQVKTTSYFDKPWLRAEVEHDKPVINTYLAAVSYVYPTHDHLVELLGWLPREIVIQRRPEQCPGDGTRPFSYLWEEHELRPLEFDQERLNRIYREYRDAVGRHSGRWNTFKHRLKAIRHL